MLAVGGQGGFLLAIAWPLCVVGLLVIAARLYGVSKRAGEIRWDFVYVALAGLFGTGALILFTISVMSGIGNHVVNLSPSQIADSLMWLWMSIFVGLAGVTFAKFAIIALLLQVHLPSQKKRRVFLWCLGAILAGISIGQVTLSLTQCTPTIRLWDLRVDGECPGKTMALGFGYFQGVSGSLIDLILALYPISIIWNLKASLKMKVGFCFLMAGGIIPAACGIAKTIRLRFLQDPKDITYEFAPFIAWSIAELYLLIILGSIPPLRPLFLRLFRKASDTLHTHSGSGTHGTPKYANEKYSNLGIAEKALAPDSDSDRSHSPSDSSKSTTESKGSSALKAKRAWGKNGLRKSAISMPLQLDQKLSPPPPVARQASGNNNSNAGRGGVAARVSVFEQRNSGVSIYGSSPPMSIPLRPSVGNTFFGGDTATTNGRGAGTGGYHGAGVRELHPPGRTYSTRVGALADQLRASSSVGSGGDSILDQYARSSMGTNVTQAPPPAPAALATGRQSRGITVRSDFEVQSNRMSSLPRTRGGQEGGDERRRYF